MVGEEATCITEEASANPVIAQEGAGGSEHRCQGGSSGRPSHGRCVD
jgi:hypothetical protein